MNPLAEPRWAEIDALFDAALERPADERTAWLRAECGQDPALYTAVERLLASDADGERAMGESATEYAQALLAAPEAEDLAPGTRMGPYRIEAEIGRGGMGVVYRASRADGAFEKAVALKMVKRGMDTDAVLARFQHERRVLAGLDHPGIARILDAGAAPDGRPWLAMELVDGEPITAFARRQRLGLRARLMLLEEVAEAVAYAHRRLVVHRDLKPSNILVASGDGSEFRVPGPELESSRRTEKHGETSGAGISNDGISATGEGRRTGARKPGARNPELATARGARVKLLDFGIARLLLPEDSGEALTRPGERVLTPEYAAPEQHAGEPTTAAVDVYALGVLAYELLTGSRPRPHPALPSAAASGEASDEMGMTPEALLRSLRGDLDTLVLTALHADPERRYASAQAFLDDLRRWRQRLPLLARPDSMRYRAGRFVARHRVGVTTAGLVLLLLASGAAWSTWRIAQERDEARGQRDRAEATATFVTGLFDAADPFAAPTGRADTLRARDLLARGAARARVALAGDPATQARVLTTIGEAQIGLGLYAAADSLLAEAVTAAKASGAADAAVRALVARGRARYNGDIPQEAVSLLREAETLASREAPASLPLARLHLGAALRRASDFDGAAEVLARIGDARGMDGLFRATVLIERGRVDQDRGRSAAAEPFYRQALALRLEALGASHPEIATALEMIGTSLLEQARLDDAAPVLADVLRIRTATLGDAHPQTASARFNLAALTRDRERYDEALAAFRDVLTADRVQFGPDHPYVAGAWLEIGITHSRAARPDSAISAYRTSLAILRRTQTDAHPVAQEALSGIGHELSESGRPREAEPLLRRVLAVRRETLGGDSWRTGVSESALGGCLWRQGRVAEAERHLVAGYETIRAASGPEGAALRRLIEMYEGTGREAEATPYRQRLAEIEA